MSTQNDTLKFVRLHDITAQHGGDFVNFLLTLTNPERREIADLLQQEGV